MVLRHIVDEFSDHLGRATPPNVKFVLTPFVDLGDASEYKAKDDGRGSKFNTNVKCVYDIDGVDYTSDYFAIDHWDFAN